ncbi:unnamed protein product [Polarella glacialis]|nr:unnamed protein product [Polarella glacialis]CAE8587336.1 unnamed protein product [Polarella glacialis]
MLPIEMEWRPCVAEAAKIGLQILRARRRQWHPLQRKLVHRLRAVAAIALPTAEVASSSLANSPASSLSVSSRASRGGARALPTRLGCGAAAGAVLTRSLADAGVEWIVLGASILSSHVSAQELARGRASAWHLELAVHLQLHGKCVLISEELGSPVLLPLPHAFLVSWRCSFRRADAEPSSALSVAATAVSFTGSVVVVSCAWPAGLGDPGTAGELFVSLGRVDDSTWDLVDVPLCAGKSLLGRRRRRRANVSVCTAPFSAMQDESRDHAVQQWIEYHRLVGVDRFLIYDYDLSLERALSRFTTTPNDSFAVHYFPRWSIIFGEALDSAANSDNPNGGFFSRDLLEPLANSHCLFASRGESDYVLLLHRHDEYIAFGPGISKGTRRPSMLAVLRQLRSLRSRMASLEVPWLIFAGNLSKRSPYVVESWALRQRFASLDYPPAGVGSRRQSLRRSGSPLVNPDNVLELLSSHWARGRPGTLHLDSSSVPAGLRVHHYMDLHGPRACLEQDTLNPCATQDFGASWALPWLRTALPPPESLAQWLPAFWCFEAVPEHRRLVVMTFCCSPTAQSRNASNFWSSNCWVVQGNPSVCCGDGFDTEAARMMGEDSWAEIETLVSQNVF